jgi:hypothetical protein
MSRRGWTRDELLLAFNLYCKLRFGQCHGRNPQVIALARVLGRTPDAVAMKLCNFASLDPTHQRRGISGLGNASRADRSVWDEFTSDWNRLAVESEGVYRERVGESTQEVTHGRQMVSDPEKELAGASTAQTEAQRLQKVRLGQAFFRSTLLASYNDQCCICGLDCNLLLVASHIVPWAVRSDLRLDPRNGLCLCAIHDKAFDRGLLSVDVEFRVLVSRRIESHAPRAVIDGTFIAYSGQPIHLPEKFAPSQEHLEHHRAHVYQAM